MPEGPSRLRLEYCYKKALLIGDRTISYKIVCNVFCKSYVDDLIVATVFKEM